MLRTHGDLGYKQEQRFHLELGLLKLAHAPRLRPIEQLLSDVSASSSVAGAPRNPARPSIVPSTAAAASGGAAETRRSPRVAPGRSNCYPFDADSAPHRD